MNNRHLISLNPKSFFLLGFFNYFIFFGFLNFLFGKILIEDLNIKSLIFLFFFSIFFFYFQKNDKNNNFSLNLNNKKLKFFFYLITLFSLFIIFYFFFKHNFFGSVFMSEVETLYDKDIRLLYGKIKAFILIPTLLFIILVLIKNQNYENKITFSLYFLLLIFFILFIIFTGRRNLILLIFFLYVFHFQFKIGVINKTKLLKIISIFFFLSFFWILISNLYIENRSFFTQNNNNTFHFDSIFEFNSTFKNFSSRPSPLYHLNNVINKFDDKDIQPTSNGKILINSFGMSLPKFLNSNKSGFLDDYLAIEYLNLENVDLSTNALASFYIEFKEYSLLFSIIFFFIFFHIYSFILSKLNKDILFFQLYLVYLFYILFSIETNLSRYFIAIYYGLALFIIQCMYQKYLKDEKHISKS